MPAPRRRVPSSDARILRAARHLVRRGGMASLTMGDIAREARVSKALVLYHFGDKDRLLVALVEHVGADVLARARVLRLSADRPLDEYWSWLEQELREGDIRVLVSLAESDAANVRAAARRVAEARRAVAAEHVEAICTHLGLSSRMPAGLVAETLLAFVDGLACRAALGVIREARGAFDMLWLALLSASE